jgi:hypothetical protein
LRRRVRQGWSAYPATAGKASLSPGAWPSQPLRHRPRSISLLAQPGGFEVGCLREGANHDPGSLTAPQCRLPRPRPRQGAAHKAGPLVSDRSLASPRGNVRVDPGPATEPSHPCRAQASLACDYRFSVARHANRSIRTNVMTPAPPRQIAERARPGRSPRSPATSPTPRVRRLRGPRHGSGRASSG